jgi:phosphohistidine phosphatase SixA
MATKRRHILGVLAGAALCGPGWGATDAASAEPAALLRAGGGGLVVAMRHALAPGTFDPPGFRRGDCSTQRNLSDEGREQARRTGAWFRAHGLEPKRVRSSAWCRCLETARLGFGRAEPWTALDSIVGQRAHETAHVPEMRAELARLAGVGAAGFEVWVTHQANIAALADAATASGEALLLRHDRRRGAVVVVALLRIA